MPIICSFDCCLLAGGGQLVGLGVDALVSNGMRVTTIESPRSGSMPAAVDTISSIAVACSSVTASSSISTATFSCVDLAGHVGRLLDDAVEGVRALLVVFHVVGVLTGRSCRTRR